MTSNKIYTLYEWEGSLHSSLVRGRLLGECCRRQIPMYIADNSMWQKSINQWKWDSRIRLPFSASIIHWLKTPTPSKTLYIPLYVQQMCQTIKGSITLSRGLWISVLQIIINNKKEYASIMQFIITWFQCITLTCFQCNTRTSLRQNSTD